MCVLIWNGKLLSSSQKNIKFSPSYRHGSQDFLKEGSFIGKEGGRVGSSNLILINYS